MFYVFTERITDCPCFPSLSLSHPTQHSHTHTQTQTHLHTTQNIHTYTHSPSQPWTPTTTTNSTSPLTTTTTTTTTALLLPQHTPHPQLLTTTSLPPTASAQPAVHSTLPPDCLIPHPSQDGLLLRPAAGHGLRRSRPREATILSTLMLSSPEAQISTKNVRSTSRKVTIS